MAINLDSMEIRNYLYLDNAFREELIKDIYKGLTALQKCIPSKYFYDARGSCLFEKICMLPEYYLTRTELSILKEVAPEIIRPFHKGDLVEMGSGGNKKIRILLDAVSGFKQASIRYVPIDVNEIALIKGSKELLAIYPKLKVLGIVADFTQHMELLPNDLTKLIVFFGGTVGNFNEKESHDLLKDIAKYMKSEDRFFIGFDMLKPKNILEAAYNDSNGITSEFNKNILNVLNRKLNANFDLSHFDHLAFFNEALERIEMHLRANRNVSVEISDLDLKVELDKGETICTEICRKFSRVSAERMFSKAGLTVTRWFSDPREWFSSVELKAQDV